MAAAPRLKVFDAHGTYQASCHDYAAAAVLVAFYGDGATVRLGHSKRETVWTQGVTGDAAEDYDAIADAILRFEDDQRSRMVARHAAYAAH